jgi:hypothetical protein
MTEAAQNIENLYVKEEGRVLDPTLLDNTLLERMPNPTGWRTAYSPYTGEKVQPTEVFTYRTKPLKKGKYKRLLPTS